MASDEGRRAGRADRDKKPGSAAHPSANGGPSATPPRPTPSPSIGKAPEHPAQQPPQRPSPARAKAASPAPDSGDLVVVTLRASTGTIVSVEMATADGARHALTDSETARLVGERPTFASLVHDAFEAGIACVLDDGAGGGDERSGETEEDVDLHDALLDALIERSAAKRLLSRETLHSAVLGTIIDAAAGNGKAPPPTA